MFVSGLAEADDDADESSASIVVDESYDFKFDHAPMDLDNQTYLESNVLTLAQMHIRSPPTRKFVR